MADSKQAWRKYQSSDFKEKSDSLPCERYIYIRNLYTKDEISADEKLKYTYRYIHVRSYEEGGYFAFKGILSADDVFKDTKGLTELIEHGRHPDFSERFVASAIDYFGPEHFGGQECITTSYQAPESSGVYSSEIDGTAEGFCLSQELNIYLRTAGIPIENDKLERINDVFTLSSEIADYLMSKRLFDEKSPSYFDYDEYIPELKSIRHKTERISNISLRALKMEIKLLHELPPILAASSDNILRMFEDEIPSTIEEADHKALIQLALDKVITYPKFIKENGLDRQR